MAFLKKYKDILILCFIFFLSFFYGLGDVPLFNLDEGAFSEATREMLRGGDLITTYLGGELRFDKPILIYWLQLLSVKIFGINEFAFRFPSALSGALWGVVIYLFVKKYIDKESAFWSAFFFASSLQITIIAKAAIADALLNLFIVLTMFSMWDYFQTKNRKYLYGVFIFMALGTLTKGPVAVLIPFAVSLFYLGIKRDFRFWLKSVFDIKGLLLFALIAFPWYIAEYLKEGQAFIEGFILKHNIQRFNSAFESHKGSSFYYIPVLLIGLLPFSGLIVYSFFKIKRFFNDLVLFLSIWFLFVFIFFSFSGTKLPHYVIYGYTPLFILAALAAKEFKYKGMIVFPSIFIFLVFAFLPQIANLFIGNIKDEYVKILIENAYLYFDTFYKVKILTAVVLLVGVYLLVKDIKKVLISVSFLFIFVINFAVIPAYASLVEEPIKEAGLFIKKNNLKNVVMHSINTPSIMVYADRVIKRDYPKKGDIVFTKVNKLKEFENYKILWKKNGVVLVWL